MYQIRDESPGLARFESSKGWDNHRTGHIGVYNPVGNAASSFERAERVKG